MHTTGEEVPVRTEPDGSGRYAKRADDRCRAGREIDGDQILKAAARSHAVHHARRGVISKACDRALPRRSDQRRCACVWIKSSQGRRAV